MSGRKRKAATETEAPVVQQTCSECGYTGRAGAEIVPYSFAKKDYRWLCWCGLRDCLAKAWRKFRDRSAD